MSATIRATTMAHAFINASVKGLKKKPTWMGKRVIEHCERDDGVGLVHEPNQIDISGRSDREICYSLRKNMGFVFTN